MDIKNKLRDAADALLIALRFFLVTIVFCFGIMIPVLYILMTVIAKLTAPFSGWVAGIIGLILFVAAILYISYLTSRGSGKLSNWIQSGHFNIEISDEKNREVRNHWLKVHNIRTKPRKFKIYLTNPNEMIFLAPVYPEKYGAPDTLAEPLMYKATIPITHKFHGNLPIDGDKVDFVLVATPNNDVKELHSVYIIDGNEGVPCLLDNNVETGKRTKFECSMPIEKNCSEKIELVLWYTPKDAEGETVLAYKFK